MAVETTVVMTCDYCKKEITKESFYLEAGSYGIQLHLGCVSTMNGEQFIVVLGLDDIKVMQRDDWEKAVKANSYYRRNK